METGDWPTLIAVITGAVSLVRVMLFQLTRLKTTIWLMSTRCEHATRRLRAVAAEACARIAQRYTFCIAG